MRSHEFQTRIFHASSFEEENLSLKKNSTNFSNPFPSKWKNYASQITLQQRWHKTCPPWMMKQRPPKKSWSTCWNNIGRTNEALCRETPSFLSSTESSRQGSEPLLPSERDPRVTRDHPRRTPLEANSRSSTGTLASFIKQFAFEIVQTISRYENKKYFLLFSVVIDSANGTRFDRGTVRIICHNKTKEEWMIFWPQM